MGMAKMSPTKKIEFVRFVITQVTGNPNFPSPSPTMATLATSANNAEAALLAAKAGGADDKANLRVKVDGMGLLMRQLVGYVETTANANPTTAEVVVLSAGLEVKRRSNPDIPVFYVMLTGNPGEVRIQHKAIRGAAYEIQICTDLTNEANWVDFEATTLSRIVKGGLTANTRYYFRARVITSTGPSAWSEVRSVFVMV